MDKLLLTVSKLKELGITKNSFTVKQIEALGQYKHKAWYSRLLHSVVTKSQFKEALLLRKKTNAEKRQSIQDRRKKVREQRKVDNAIKAANKPLKKKKKKVKKEKGKSGAWWNKYRKYLLSKEWSDIRIDIFNSRGKKCEQCGSTKSLQIHHLHYRNVFKEEPEDLMILCGVCHKLEHDK